MENNEARTPAEVKKVSKKKNLDFEAETSRRRKQRKEVILSTLN